MILSRGDASKYAGKECPGSLAHAVQEVAPEGLVHRLVSCGAFSAATISLACTTFSYVLVGSSAARGCNT